MIKHPKRRGEWVELQFMARAAAHGLTVSKPWGDSARYDFAVEHAGHFSRVQVKSTSYFSTTRRGRSSAYLCNIVSRSGSPYDHSRTYDARQIDFFALFIVPEEIWYIIPVADLRDAHWALQLNPYDRRNKYFPYLEAWHLLRGDA